ncbi:hypothetical protein BCR43DRAFT_500269 [Syncephalastrum racemosum]|uniref:Uncharacterized protein n=1 Tax=Syncephalastrum racemosum TaxID=13706 RepID=A0A1X2HSU6_SYNRA|nr:hypothetical protein BCR43DRAFT_500269 [Syncephalastrum racemosum]
MRLATFTVVSALVASVLGATVPEKRGCADQEVFNEQHFDGDCFGECLDSGNHPSVCRHFCRNYSVQEDRYPRACQLPYLHVCGSECPYVGICKDQNGLDHFLCSCHRDHENIPEIPNCSEVKKCSWGW